MNPKDTIECKHFFSGAAAYANKRIFMTLTTVGLALKLPRDSRELLISNGARPLRYFFERPDEEGLCGRSEGACRQRRDADPLD
jgi:hypothetical protein